VEPPSLFGKAVFKGSGLLHSTAMLGHSQPLEPLVMTLNKVDVVSVPGLKPGYW
jgi:hypothetical protein